MAAWTDFYKSTELYLAQVALGDWPATGRFFLGTDLAGYLLEWYDIVQEEYAFAKGTATLTVSTHTFLETAVATDIQRIDATYFTPASSTATYRLAPRQQEDLDELQPGWGTQTETTDSVVVYPISAGTWGLWPRPVANSVVRVEYTKRLRPGDSQVSGLPGWCHYGSTPYILYRAYSRFGPLQNLQKAAAFRALHERDMRTFRTIFDHILPRQAPHARPAAGAQARVLTPRRNWR